MTVGQTLDKFSGVSLDNCTQMCYYKVGCTQFNFYFSKIPTDSWSRCVLVKSGNAKKPTMNNKNYVLSGDKCSMKQMTNELRPQQMNKLQIHNGTKVVSEDLKSFSDVDSLESCINLCHHTEKCEAFEYHGEGLQVQWNKNSCNLKYKVTGFEISTSPDIVSGKASFVCQTRTFKNQEAIGQNIAVEKFKKLENCIDTCHKTEECHGFSYYHKQKLCFIKASVRHYQETEGVTSGRACYHPPTYVNTSLADVSVNAPGAKSAVMSMVMMSEPELDCHLLTPEPETGNTSVSVRRKRGLNENLKLETPPNIDILINPNLKNKREEYEQYVMNKLRNFFKGKNSTKIYPNLFRLLWYTKVRVFI